MTRLDFKIIILVERKKRKKKTLRKDIREVRLHA